MGMWPLAADTLLAVYQRCRNKFSERTSNEEQGSIDNKTMNLQAKLVLIDPIPVPMDRHCADSRTKRCRVY